MRQIIDDTPAALKPRFALFFAPRAARLAAIRWYDCPAVNDAQSVVKKAVEVNSAILMQLRHKDILQPAPPDLIVEPLIELARNRRHIMAVDTPIIESQRNEIAELIAQGQISNLRSCAALCPQLCRSGLFSDGKIIFRDLCFTLQAGIFPLKILE